MKVTAFNPEFSAELGGGTTVIIEDVVSQLTLDDLLDVDASAPTDGDVLTWDDYQGLWVPAAGGGSLALDDLTDVSAAAPSDGDVIVWDSGTSLWVAQAPPGGALALDDLTDVNAPAPGDGDFLAYDSGTGDWVNVGAPSGTVPDGTDPGDMLVWDGDYGWDILPVGADDEILTADSGEALGVKWAAGGGGGVTQSYVGYNTVGGSTETFVGFTTIYCRQITLATPGLLAAVAAYVEEFGDTVGDYHAGVYTDSGGTPDRVMAMNAAPTGVFETGEGSGFQARWLEIGLGLWLPAGTYWLGWRLNAGSSQRIYYDATGADKKVVTVQHRWADAGRYGATAATSNDYSIRGTIIR